MRPPFGLMSVFPWLAAVSLLAACGKGEQTGTLTVRYELEPNGQTCQSRGVATVRATLLKGGAVEVSEEDDCDPSEEIVLDGVAAGNYQLLVEGLDAEPDTVIDNLGSDGEPDAVEVLGGAAGDFTAKLFPTPATVRVRWELEQDGFQAQCGTVPPAFFRITPNNSSAGPLLNTDDGCGCHTFACADLPDSDMQYHIVPDPMRDLNGDLLDLVTVEILDAQENPIDEENLVIDPPPGHGKSVDITISCEGDVCGAVAVSSAGEPGNLDTGTGG